jgi:tetratricopeptide (TPR) repeat protein
MSSRWTLLLVMHIAGFGGAATAQTLDQQQQCPAADPDLSISGCTAMIKSGHETQQKLAIDFFNRGAAYMAKEKYDSAIEDFDQAVRLNPNYAAAFVGRGAAYVAKGQVDSAIEDYDQAVRLNPNSAAAFVGRGVRLSGSALVTPWPPGPISNGAMPTSARGWPRVGRLLYLLVP